jgi:hypothetical protein
MVEGSLMHSIVLVPATQVKYRIGDDGTLWCILIWWLSSMDAIQMFVTA